MYLNIEIYVYIYIPVQVHGHMCVQNVSTCVCVLVKPPIVENISIQFSGHHVNVIFTSFTVIIQPATSLSAKVWRLVQNKKIGHQLPINL